MHNRVKSKASRGQTQNLSLSARCAREPITVIVVLSISLCIMRDKKSLLLLLLWLPLISEYNSEQENRLTEQRATQTAAIHGIDKMMMQQHQPKKEGVEVVVVGI